eukprot:CAMPEP_0196718780 /NCGR_PEP_ID=MMETSP1091-20130531/1897_1 /TAXON_ID=302021 /ORGANISM="Rhodomonas sp., Strain CCMP768" /LENGTH=39 /DNA_ID= /DNA_START= /DNA_END= /DNA_ORIENTATION=
MGHRTRREARAEGQPDIGQARSGRDKAECASNEEEEERG